MRSRKILISILAIVLVMAVGLAIWLMVEKKSVKFWQGTKVPRSTVINVQALSGYKETGVKTVIYSAAQNVSEVTSKNNNKTVSFETTDSVDGVINIYSQDLTNRYPKYTTFKKEIGKSEATDKKAIVLTCDGKDGTITVTTWAKTNGMTQVEIATSADFK